jgi:hypothetical protein
MKSRFLDSDDCVLQLETNGRWVRITGGDDGACVSIPGIDLPRLVHELQIIANEYPLIASEAHDMHDLHASGGMP